MLHSNGAASSCNVVFASDAVAASAAAAKSGALSRSAALMSLREACRAESLGGPLLLVGPSTADVRCPHTMTRPDLHVLLDTPLTVFSPPQ